MKFLRLVPAILAATFLAIGPVFADTAGTGYTLGPRGFSYPVPVLVSAAAFTALAETSSRTTDAIPVTGLNSVTFYLSHLDADASVTKVAMACDASDDYGVTWFVVQSCAISAGTCASSDAAWNKGDGVTGPGTKKWPWTVNVDVATELRCTFTFSGAPAAADKLTVTARGGAQ